MPADHAPGSIAHRLFSIASQSRKTDCAARPPASPAGLHHDAPRADVPVASASPAAAPPASMARAEGAMTLQPAAPTRSTALPGPSVDRRCIAVITAGHTPPALTNAPMHALVGARDRADAAGTTSTRDRSTTKPPGSTAAAAAPASGLEGSADAEAAVALDGPQALPDAAAAAAEAGGGAMAAKSVLGSASWSSAVPVSKRRRSWPRGPAMPAVGGTDAPDAAIAQLGGPPSLSQATLISSSASRSAGSAGG